MADEYKDGHNGEKGPKKTFSIVVSGVQKTTDKHKLTYEDVLAFQNLVPDYENPYLVTFERGPDGQVEGTLDSGRFVVLKDGMVFHVSPTNQS